MIKKYSPHILTISTALSIFCAVVLSCGANLFGSDPMGKQPIWSSFLLFGFAIIFAAIPFYFGNKQGKYKPSFHLATLLLILLLINVIALLIYNNPTTYSFVDPLHNSYLINYSALGTDLAVYELRLFGLLLNVFIILDFLPKFYKTNHAFKVVCYCVLTFGIVAIISSFFLDSMKYYFLLTFDNFFIRFHTLAIYSFFASKNSFGTTMLLCLVASLFLFKEKKNPWWLIALFISTIWLLLSQCKMGILTGLLIEVGYFIALYVLTFKNNQKRNAVIGLSILGGLILLIGLMFIVPPTREFILKLFSNLFREENGLNTLETRQTMWSYTFIILSNSNYFTGVGYGLFNDILYAFTSVDIKNIAMYQTTTSHNVILQLLGDGGIVLLLVWLTLMLYIVYLSVKLLKFNKEAAITALIMIGSMLIYGIFESSCLIIVGTGEFLVLTILITWPIMQLKQQTPELVEDKILKLI